MRPTAAIRARYADVSMTRTIGAECAKTFRKLAFPGSRTAREADVETTFDPHDRRAVAHERDDPRQAR
jgi:hypothetical protein